MMNISECDACRRLRDEPCIEIDAAAKKAAPGIYHSVGKKAED